ncbi:hypothetical protein KI387_012211, partial [Taxus chinensis]
VWVITVPWWPTQSSIMELCMTFHNVFSSTRHVNYAIGPKSPRKITFAKWKKRVDGPRDVFLSKKRKMQTGWPEDDFLPKVGLRGQGGIFPMSKCGPVGLQETLKLYTFSQMVQFSSADPQARG